MTRYGISEEGAAAMELLGEKLRNAANGIGTQSSNLNSKVTALSSGGRLGIFGDEIKTLTTGNSAAVQRANENIGVISQKAKSIAGKIRELVSVGLGGTPVSGGSGSAGAASANISNSGNISAGFGNRMTSEAAINGSDNYSGSGTSTSGSGGTNYVGSEFVNPFNSNNGENNFIKSENLDAYLKPEVGATPRSLEKTQLGYRKTEDGGWVYDSPKETNKYLIQEQGRAYPDKFRGTCGLCSCANVLCMSGKKVTEKEIIDYASNTRLMGDKGVIYDSIINERGEKVYYRGDDDGAIVAATVNDKDEILDEKDIFLCENNSPNPEFNGVSSCFARKQILKHFGIESEMESVELDDNYEVSNKTIENIAGHISEGKGVILSVDAGTLWDNQEYAGQGHSVTVTSVKKDSEGNVLGFFICDTGNYNETAPEENYYSAEKIRQSLYQCPINVTQIIR